MGEKISREVVFLGEYADTTGDGKIRWIGFKALSITGEEKEFLWWRNFCDTLDNLKAFCDLLFEKRGIEARIGPAINLGKSSQASGHVEVIPSTDKGESVYGIYVESKHRLMFNFMLAIKGL